MSKNGAERIELRLLLHVAAVAAISTVAAEAIVASVTSVDALATDEGCRTTTIDTVDNLATVDTILVMVEVTLCDVSHGETGDAILIKLFKQLFHVVLIISALGILDVNAFAVLGIFTFLCYGFFGSAC